MILHRINLALAIALIVWGEYANDLYPFWLGCTLLIVTAIRMPR